MIRLAILGTLFALFAGNTSLFGVPLALPAYLAVWALLLADALARPRRSHSVPTLWIPLILHGAWLWWLVFSALWAVELPGRELVEVSGLALLALTAFALFTRMERRDHDFLWWVVVAVALVFAIGGYAGTGSTPGRMSAFGGGPNVFVRYMAFGALGAVFLAVRYARPRYYALLPIFLVAAVLSGSRGGMLGIAVVGLATLLFLAASGQRTAIGWLTGVLVAGAGIVMAVPSFRTIVEEFVVRRYVVLTFRQGYSSGRDVLVERALDSIALHQLGGLGLGGFAARFAGNDGLTHPHNLFLTTMAESGPVGVLLLSAALGALLLGVWRARARVDVFIPAMCALVIFISSMFSGYYGDSRFLWFFGFLALAAPQLPDRKAPRS